MTPTPAPAEEDIRYNLIPTIKKFHECPAQKRCIIGPVGCYSGDTEFLSLDGWVRFDQYDGQKVAQYDRRTAIIGFTDPIRYIKEPCEEFIHFYNKHSMSMVLSEEHKMLLWNYRDWAIVKTAGEVERSPSRYTVPTNFRVDTPGVEITDDDLRLMVAFHADGNIQPIGQKQRISVCKNRKKERLMSLLEAAGREYSTGTTKKRPEERWFAFIPPVLSKQYTEWCWPLSARQLEIIVDELQYWDGLYKGDDYRFSTTIKKEADFIQYAVHACGGRATISTEVYPQDNWNDGYIVHIALKTSYKSKVMLRGDTTTIERIPSEDGFKYCFQVPTGFLVVRHNGRVFVSGNSGKTTAAAWEVCYMLPKFMFDVHGIKKTIFAVIRNTSVELRDTTLRSILEWFPFAVYRVQAMILTITWPEGFEVELLLRACDNEKHVRQFKSLQVTGYWIDESIEVAESTKRMLKTRIGRFPKRSPAQFGIETSNPPDIEHPTYSQFDWGDTPPPGPVPNGKPLDNHIGFWQPPYENVANLPVNYYENLKKDFADNLDWLEMYVEGKPGQLIRGKLVYDNFDRTYHCATKPLIWGGQDLYRGWDNSGNTPACVVVCPVTIGRLHIFREFVTVRENAVDFANRVIEECNQSFPNAKFTDYGDPAGEATYSTRDGTFTSNAQLMSDECGINVTSGEQNFKKRVNSVDQALLKRDGVLIDPSCIRLINGFLGGYHYPELTNMPGHYKKEPQKNKYAHIAEALQYVCTMLYTSAAPPISDADVYPDDDIEPTY